MIAYAAVVPDGQGWKQVGELMLAFGLASVIGLERQWRGKSAGLRTQAIVGTASALILLVSKYGFTDVLTDHSIVLDPSRVAAQIVSGIGFLGAGIIITRQGTIRGLTTAASVWETAAVGMAAGAGLPYLALVVTGLHFVIVLGFSRLSHWVTVHGHGERGYHVTYRDGQGVLRDLLAACTAHGWTVGSMEVLHHDAGGDPDGRLVTVGLSLRGHRVGEAASVLAPLSGVNRVEGIDDDE
jgi:putative Mg2+ transporter-C (MgtC) family protein